jgi:hypothetical protein
MRLTDYVTLNFNNNICTAVVFLDIEKAFDSTWHPGLLYKLSELHFSPSLIKLINSFLSHRKFRVMYEGELSTPRNIQEGVTQGSVLSPTLYSLYINDTSQTLGVYLALFTDDTYLYSTDHEVGFVLRKFQRSLTAMESWCERWNIKNNKEKTQAICFSHRPTLVEDFITLNGRQIPFSNHVKYLSVIFDKKLYGNYTHEMIATKALRNFLASTPS